MWLLPEGTTWLDLATLAVALVGIGLAAVNLVLRARRDRLDTQHAVRMKVSIGPRWPDEDIWIDLTNPAPRKITIVSAGFAMAPRGKYPPYQWAVVDASRVAIGTPVPLLVPQPLPVTLESGMPAHRLSTPVWRVRNVYNKIVPLYAWCEDSYGAKYFEALPSRVIDTIKSTKRRKLGPPDAAGHRAVVDAPDGERIDFADRVR